MIEIISAVRCTGCDLCVRVCPTNVFDRRPGAPPAIARQDDCQTCFLCEAHCPVDAMYVSPLRTPADPGSVHRDERRLADAGVLGDYRARLGWASGSRPPRTGEDALRLAGGRRPLR